MNFRHSKAFPRGVTGCDIYRREYAGQKRPDFVHFWYKTPIHQQIVCLNSTPPSAFNAKPQRRNVAKFLLLFRTILITSILRVVFLLINPTSLWYSCCSKNYKQEFFWNFAE